MHCPVLGYCYECVKCYFGLRLFVHHNTERNTLSKLLLECTISSVARELATYRLHVEVYRKLGGTRQAPYEQRIKCFLRKRKLK